jgi:hypothetical protein
MRRKPPVWGMPFHDLNGLVGPRPRRSARYDLRPVNDAACAGTAGQAGVAPDP